MKVGSKDLSQFWTAKVSAGLSGLRSVLGLKCLESELSVTSYHLQFHYRFHLYDR